MDISNYLNLLLLPLLSLYQYEQLLLPTKSFNNDSLTKSPSSFITTA